MFSFILNWLVTWFSVVNPYAYVPNLPIKNLVRFLFSLGEATRESQDYKERIREQTLQLSAYQSEIEHLRKQINNLEDDCEKDKKRIETLTDALAKARLVWG